MILSFDVKETEHDTTLIETDHGTMWKDIEKHNPLKQIGYDLPCNIVDGEKAMISS